MEPQSSTELTRQAIALKKAGDTSGAVPLLVQAITITPDFEAAWLWLAACLTMPAERRYCLEQALSANPESPPALAGLPRFAHVDSMRPAVLDAETIAAPLDIGPVRVVAPTRPLGPQKSTRLFWPALFFASIIGILVISVGAFMFVPSVATLIPLIATPTPTCEAALPVFVITLEPLAREWDDANALAGSTPRMALAPQINNLQSVRRRVQDLPTPACGAGMKEHLVGAMDATIEGYVAFLGQKSDTEVQRHFTTASTEMDAYKSFVQKILTTGPSV